MKIIIKHIDSDIPKDNYEFFNDFINYLQINLVENKKIILFDLIIKVNCYYYDQDWYNKVIECYE
jgi:hypothetical protein